MKPDPGRVVQSTDSDYLHLWNHYMEKYLSANTELAMGIHLRQRMSQARINSRNHKKLHQAILKARSRDTTRVFNLLNWKEKMETDAKYAYGWMMDWFQ